MKQKSLFYNFLSVFSNGEFFMPKTAKTIFNTTEKSNFILNMTPESYWKFNLKILTGFLILMPLFSVLLEFMKVYSVPGMALSITGVFAIVFMFIGFMKDETPKALYLPAYLLGGMLIWGLVSLYNSYFYSISLFGSDGRNEGWLSLFFYGSFFLLGAQLGTNENRLKLLHGMLCLGLVECLWSVLQMLPIGFPSYYRNLEPILIFNVFLPSGLTGSPIFLAILLSVLLVFALIESIFTENKKIRLLDNCCIICFSLTAIRTQCLHGIIGVILAVAIALVYGLMQKNSKKSAICLLISLLGIIIGFGWNYFSSSLNGTYAIKEGGQQAVPNTIECYDGAIIFEDASYRLAVSGYYVKNENNNPNGSFDIESIPETYAYLWKNTLKIISRYPLAGSGEDSLVYPQLYQNPQIPSNPNVFDRCYNGYLQIAGTMGIPMLILFLALMILTISRGIQAHKQEKNWLCAGVCSSVIVYLLLMLFGAGSITITPIFWMLAGMCISFRKQA